MDKEESGESDFEMLKSQKNNPYPVADLFESVAGYLRFLSDIGYSGLECPDKIYEQVHAWGRDAGKKGRSASGLLNDFKKCRKCSLSASSQRMICGEGNSKARLAIVGGAASAEDMKTGRPYSGKPGELLDKMLAAMGFARDEVYITRALKCCPPDNQKPNPGDVKICRAYLEKELKLVRPLIICAFGDIAAMALLETSVPLSGLRGRFHDFNGMQVMPTYSPEYLFENPGAKRQAWEDLKRVMDVLK
jgi:DNA polymerase